MKHCVAVKMVLENVILSWKNIVFRQAGYKKHLHLVTALFYKICTCVKNKHAWKKYGRGYTLSRQQQLCLVNIPLVGLCFPIFL